MKQSVEQFHTQRPDLNTLGYPQLRYKVKPIKLGEEITKTTGIQL